MKILILVLSVGMLIGCGAQDSSMVQTNMITSWHLMQNAEAERSIHKGFVKSPRDLTVQLLPGVFDINGTGSLASYFVFMDPIIDFSMIASLDARPPDSLNLLLWRHIMGTFADNASDTCVGKDSISNYDYKVKPGFSSLLKSLCSESITKGQLENLWFSTVGFEQSKYMGDWIGRALAEVSGLSGSHKLKVLMYSILLHPAFIMNL